MYRARSDCAKTMRELIFANFSKEKKKEEAMNS